MKRLARVRAILVKELRQLGRDRLTFALVAGLPIMQLLLFGYAINTDVRDLGAVVVDQAGTSLSRELTNAVKATQVVDIRYELSAPAEVEAGLRAGEFVVGIVIPPDFDRRLARGDEPAAQLLVDGSDPTIFGVARQLTAMPLALDTGRRAEPASPVFEVRAFYNPERRSQVNIVPGLLGVILTMTMVMFTAIAIVRERELGNLEFLINTPVRNIELMIGKILPYIAIGLIQLSLLLLLGAWLFAVPMRGDLLDLYVVSLVFIAANLALGLVISTLSKTQFQAMQMTVFILLPSILLSGFMFPFDGMPLAAQYLAEVLPMTHYVRLTRGIMLREAGPLEMTGELLALAVFFAAATTVAALRFKKSLD